ARRAHLELVGIGCHIGSMMTSAAPFIDAAARIGALAERLERAAIGLSHIDLGGGFGIRYRDDPPAPITEFLDGALGVLAGRRETLIVDPGRAIVGNAGVLLTRVEYVKPGEAKNFLVVDAAMNDLPRPALYDAWHDVRPAREPESGATAGVYDIVGPVCESADFLARDRTLAARPGDLLAVMSSGAYAMAMSSNYNSRPRAAEIMVHGDRAQLVRRRERVEELFGSESAPSW
ncbi:MAG: diaminopimelate decarboxylase family protein, partial [Burkholderiales bacterium]